jgi:hypothetical protein
VFYVNLEGLKLNETRQLLVCAVVDNLPSENLNAIKMNPEALLVPITEIGLGINAEKTKHIYKYSCIKRMLMVVFVCTKIYRV